MKAHAARQPIGTTLSVPILVRPRPEHAEPTFVASLVLFKFGLRGQESLDLTQLLGHLLAGNLVFVYVADGFVGGECDGLEWRWYELLQGVGNAAELLAHVLELDVEGEQAHGLRSPSSSGPSDDARSWSDSGWSVLRRSTLTFTPLPLLVSPNVSNISLRSSAVALTNTLPS